MTAGVAALAPTRCENYMDAKFGGEDADMAESQRSCRDRETPCSGSCSCSSSAESQRP